MRNKTDLIVPVYRGLEETQRCIESVLRTMPPAKSQLIVINDCSPDELVSQYLKKRAETGNFMLIENKENLGFVATVNKGMALNPEHDVVLLNSDVEVANDWLGRMTEAAYSDAKIGSVTPFSNNATICSFPNFCEDNKLFDGLSVAEIDRICAQANPDNSIVDIPTGVGFCLFLKRSCLNQIGFFDADTFGKGYGEENDWCQRAIKAGWRNVHQMNVFAFHQGGVSFADEQDPRKDRALELMDQLHPNFQRDVHQFIAEDPAKLYRINLLLHLIANDKQPKVLCIDHGLGGGVVQHIEELAVTFGNKLRLLRLHPCGEGLVKLVFSLITNIKDALIFNIADQYDDFLVLCKFLGIGHIHFHHTMGLPTRLWGLPADIDCQYDMTIHDYYHINGNPTLTDKQARFCGDEPDRDAMCHEHYPIPVPADVWRDSQRTLLSNARWVILPSHDTQERFTPVFSLTNNIVAWHPDSVSHEGFPEPVNKFAVSNRRNLRVLVLGAISREKGADVLEAVADTLAGQAIDFHLLGYAYRPLSNKVKTHGPYELDEVDSKIAGIDPDIVWFPAQWPETYSYTLSSALISGLPVVVPNIGAFAERVAGRAQSIVMPWNLSVNDWADFWRGIVNSKSIPANASKKLCDANVSFYQKHYGEESWARRSLATIELSMVSDWLASDHSNQRILGHKERVLRRLWRMREHAVFGRLARLIPFSVQRYIKRRLSPKPIHEVIR